MKKLLTILLLISTAYAQTQIKYIDPTTKDTVFTNYTFTQPLPVITATTTVHGYKPPVVVPPVITPPVVTPPSTGMTTVGTTVSGPITLKSNTNYTGLIIDMKGGAGVAMNGSGVSNVTITNCKIYNGGVGSIAVHLDNCSNVTIQNSFITMVARGFWFTNCKSNVKILNSQILNTFGDTTGKAKWHSIAYENCSGGGLWVVGNRIKNDTINSRYTHDEISIFKCNGVVGDSVRITDNMIWGNQFIQNGTGWRGMTNANNGADGIVLGDEGGSFQVARNNIMVYTGILIPGGGSNIKCDHNVSYSAGPIGGNGAGIIYLGGTNVYVGFNQVSYTQFNGKNLDFNIKTPLPAGSTTNIHNPKLDERILPNPLITYQ